MSVAHRPPERVEVPEDHQMRERFARILAVLIVVSTLGVACVEYLHSIADKNAESAGSAAQVLGIQRQGELVRADDAARTQVDDYAYSAEERARAGNAFQQFLLPSVTEGSSQANLLQLEETRWTQLAALTGKLTDVTPDGRTAPSQDPRFPNLELSSKEHESDRLFALQDASNQLQTDWQTRVGFLSVVLTLFAVAIYLFGLSLTLQARVRRMLVGLGLLLVAVAGVWTVALQFGSPVAAPEAAAGAYADGVAALDTFYSQPGSTGLQTADADFSRAISLRPTFAYAYVQRSLVRFLLGSPQRTDSIVSVTTPQALQAQGADLQKAYDLGERDKLLLNDLAANHLLLAVEHNQTQDIAPAIGYLADAMKLDSTDPLLYYNEGIGYLAEGNVSAARDAYQQAVAHTVYSDVSKKTPRSDPNAEEGYAGGALTPLDLLAHARPDLASQTRAMKELIIAGVDDTKPHQGSASVQFSNTAVQVFGGELQWTANLSGYNPATDEVSTQWYYQGPAKLGWSVLEPISGVSAPSLSNDASGNQYFDIRRYLAVSDQCLQPGSYKVEVYVNGHTAGTAQTDATIPSFTASTMPDVGTSVCRPADWKVDTTNVLQGFSSGLVSADHSAGVYALRFQNPSPSPGTDALTEAKAYRDEFFNLTGFLPAGISPQFLQETSSPYFLGLQGANEAYYSYDGGYVRIGSGVTADGAVLIGVVFGPSSQWNGDHSEDDAVFDSMISLG